MKVLNLRCTNGHSFEGWFASDDDFMAQNGGSAIECPLCGDNVISRMPTAPRLNLHTARGSAEPTLPAQRKPAEGTGTGAVTSTSTSTGAAAPDVVKAAMPADLQAAWLQTVRHLMENTDDVGNRFAEEARRMHYGEEPPRGIRGNASAAEREALREEGIDTVAIPMPRAMKGPVQ